MDLQTVGTIIGIVVGAMAMGTGIIRGTQWMVGKRRGVQRDGTKTFRRDLYHISPPGFPRTRFPIHYKVAGTSAGARRGAVAKGKGLVVCLQDFELSHDGMEVWVSVENESEDVYRWFTCEVTAYGSIPYDIISPTVLEGGDPWLFNVYPGEQYTCYYQFEFPEHVTGPKYLTCKSSDEPLTFWWAHGA